MPLELEVLTSSAIHAFVDHQTSIEVRRAVGACARVDERAARLISALQWQLGLLHAAFGEVIDEPVPARLLEVVRRGAGGRAAAVGSAASPGDP